MTSVGGATIINCNSCRGKFTLMVVNQHGAEKRYYFRRSQLVILSVAFTITAVVIYFLGVLTGKQVGENSFPRNESSRVKIPIETLVQESSPERAVQSEKALAFQDKLIERAGAEPSVQEPRREAKRLEKIATAEVKQDAPPVRENDSSTTKRTRERVGVKTAELPAAQSPIQLSEGTAVAAAGQMWTVQVRAFPDESSATVEVYKLRSKGYNAYVVEATIQGRPWYRVRVGLLVTQNEAEDLRKTLGSKEGLTDAFLTKQ